LNARVVWQAMVDGRLEELLESLPDEFHKWAFDTADSIGDQAVGIAGAARYAYRQIVANASVFDRADFAEEAKTRGNLAPLLFQLYDGKDIAPTVLKQLRPSGAVVPRNFEEAA